MDACPRPEISYPCRVPLKVIGRLGILEPARIAELIQEHLGPQASADQEPTAIHHGAHISYTFWVTLAKETDERPLREAFQRLPGYLLQL
ncbi:MAG: DUF493 family protein [Holophaga sp.]|nr:DUF493 family protein [Holophaga sp.]